MGKSLPFRLQLLVILAKWGGLMASSIPVAAIFPPLRRKLPWTTFLAQEYSDNVALAFDLFLLCVFGFQHSLMIRGPFARFWKKRVAKANQGAVYSACSGLASLIIVVCWQDASNVRGGFRVANSFRTPILLVKIAFVIFGVLFVKWSMSILGPVADLVGVKRLKRHFYGKEPAGKPSLITHGAFSICRHPDYLSVLSLMLFSPIAGESACELIPLEWSEILLHFGFAIYVLVGVLFEEKALEKMFGEEWRIYKKQVPALINLTPWRTLDLGTKKQE